MGGLQCWVPALFVNFILVPAHYRVLFVNIVQIGFGVVISKMVNKPYAEALEKIEGTDASATDAIAANTSAIAEGSDTPPKQDQD